MLFAILLSGLIRECNKLSFISPSEEIKSNKETQKQLEKINEGYKEMFGFYKVDGAFYSYAKDKEDRRIKIERKNAWLASEEIKYIASANNPVVVLNDAFPQNESTPCDISILQLQNEKRIMDIIQNNAYRAVRVKRIPPLETKKSFQEWHDENP